MEEVEGKKPEEAAPENIPMGGYLGKMMEVEIPRTYRWTLHPSDSDDVVMWIQKVGYDLVSKKLNVAVMESGNHVAFSWLNKAARHQSQASLSLYDACGATLHSVHFNGLKMTKHNCRLDYSNSDVLTHEVEFEFTSAMAYK